MDINVNDFPEVLCGPILRRVESHKVSVFVATKNRYWVQLKLYDDHVEYDNTDAEISWHTGYQYPLQKMVRLGKHLYVVVVTLEIPAEFDDGTTAPESIMGLEENKIYSYNIYFHSTDNVNNPANTNFSLARTDLGLLNEEGHQLGYKPGLLPSFSVPPINIDDFNLFQGSCRKPHGGGRDMLAIMDDYLRHGKYNSANERAHLLVLTGDQIYADDVSPTLLKMQHETAKALLGWVEEYPNTSPGTEKIIVKLDELEGQLTTLATDIDNDTIETAVSMLLGYIYNSNKQNDEESGFFAGPSNLLLKKALSGFKKYIESELEGFQPTKSMVLHYINLIKKWVEEHKHIFDNLKSDQNWGQIEIKFDIADETTFFQSLKKIFDSTITVIDSTSDTIFDSYAILDELFSDDFSGKGIIDKLRFYKDSYETLKSDVNTPIDKLKDWAEEFKDKTETIIVQNYIASRISPPQREKELKQFCALTSDAMSSHLMFLGEFYMMYLFTWSDVLWLKKGDNGNYVQNKPYFYESVPNYSLTGPLSKWGIGETNKSTDAYLADLPKVRRVLANIPVMMMFDDHEVTDDWNLNEDWVKTVNASVMGPQFLRNALCAYAVFQDWGNQPDDYIETADGQQKTKGRKILDALTVTESNGTISAPNLFNDIPTIFEISSLFGVGPEVANGLGRISAESVENEDENEFVGFDSSEDYTIIKSINRKQWDWEYKFYSANNKFKIISLDTRTQRGFPNERWGLRYTLLYGDLSGSTDIEDLPKPGGKIAAANLIHTEELGRQLNDRLNNTMVNIVLSPAPVFGLPLLEDFFQRYSAFSSGPEVADFEAWQGNPHGFNILVDTLRRGKQVILLSGDVHYAYSNTIEFNGDTETDSKFKLMQCCSSSLKNENALTRILGRIGRAGHFLQILTPDIDWSWDIINMLKEISEFLADTAKEIKGSAEVVVEGQISNLPDFPAIKTWFGETAPLVNMFNPESYITYYLALKDNALLSFNSLTPKGMWAIGSGVINYMVEELFNYKFWGEQGEYNKDDFTIKFLKDMRQHDQRVEATALLNNTSKNDIENRPGIKHRLSRASEVVGFNNFGRIAFTTDTTDTSQLDKVRHHIYWQTHDHKANPEDTLAETIHGELPKPNEFKLRLVDIAKDEHAKWNPPGGAKKIEHTSAQGQAYWKEYLAYMAAENKGEELENYQKFWGPIGANGNYLAWSALFISYIVKRAGASDTFFYSSRHADYVGKAKYNRKEGEDNPFWLYNYQEIEPEVGDMIVRTYDENPVPPVGYDDILLVVDDSLPYFIHTDVIVEKTKDKITTIGGNVSDSVTKRYISLDQERIATENYMVALLKVRTDI